METLSNQTRVCYPAGGFRRPPRAQEARGGRSFAKHSFY